MAVLLEHVKSIIDEAPERRKAKEVDAQSDIDTLKGKLNDGPSLLDVLLQTPAELDEVKHRI
jgi:hypothetical protein